MTLFVFMIHNDKRQNIKPSSVVILALKRPCDSSPCENNSTCVNSGDSFTCICSLGFKGRTCQENVDECNPFPWLVRVFILAFNRASPVDVRHYSSMKTICIQSCRSLSLTYTFVNIYKILIKREIKLQMVQIL